MADSVVDSILAARYFRAGEKSFEDVCRRVANALGETPDGAGTFVRRQAG